MIALARVSTGPDLEGAFREGLGGIEPGAVVTGPGSLAGYLAAACARSRAAFPGLAVDERAFVRHLGRCAAGGRDGPVALDELEVEDLYLACACVEGVPGAAEAYEARCARPVRAVLAGFTRVASEQDEIEQLVRVAVLVGRRGGPPKIAGYLGRGALGRWVGVVAQRIALATLQADALKQRAPELDELASVLDYRDPGIALIKERYRGAFRQALEDALGKLERRPRLLLRLNLVDGVSTVSLARMFGVSQPTASRWVAQARERVADELKRLLAERLSLDPTEIESLAALVISQLDLNLSMLLGAD
jgi:RNA polymerase sigma-70 factor (ECF subfamily)